MSSFLECVGSDSGHYNDREEISMDDVKSYLFLKDLMNRELTNSNANDKKAEALNVKGRNIEWNSVNKPKDKRRKYKGKSKFGNYCKKKRHIIDDCWKLQIKEKCNFKCQSSKPK